MATNLVTLAEYKAYVGITSPSQDAVINAIIPKVSKLVKTICRRTFVDYVEDSKVEVSQGGIGSSIYLSEYPLIQVILVELSTDYGATYTDLTEFTDYAVNMEDGSIVSLASDGTFPKYINGYRVTYNGGYEELPEDLKLAVMDLVTYYMKNDSAVHSPKAPGTNSVQIEYITGATRLPSHIKRILDFYVGSFD